MSYLKCLTVAALCLAAMLAACGGDDGGGSGPARIAVPQCSPQGCGPHGPPPQGRRATAAALCPADPEIAKDTYLGGAGSGEIVRLRIDALAMTYRLTWLESPVPRVPGEVAPTRAGITITGRVAHPPAGSLPTEEQARCAFVLQPGSTQAGQPGPAYTTDADFNRDNPPTVFIGFGVAGGGIPGATLRYDGQPMMRVIRSNPGFQGLVAMLGDTAVLDNIIEAFRAVDANSWNSWMSLTAWTGWYSVGPRLDEIGIDRATRQRIVSVLTDLKTHGVRDMLQKLIGPSAEQIVSMPIGAIERRHVDFYPFLGFSSTTNDLSQLPGTYDGLLYHATPSGNHATRGATTVETFDVDGNCHGTSRCLTTGARWQAGPNGYFDSAGAPRIGRPFSVPLDPVMLEGVAASLSSVETMLAGKHQDLKAWDATLGQNMEKLGGYLKQLAPLFDVARRMPAEPSATAHMVLGRLNGATIALIVRTGAVSLGTAAQGYADARIDDESGIAVLAARRARAADPLDGTYVGADSNFKYTTATFKGEAGLFSALASQRPEDSLMLDRHAGTPGPWQIVAGQAGAAHGHLIAAGGLYVALIDGAMNGGPATSSTTFGIAPNIDTAPSAPYFGVGARVGN